MKIKVTHIDPEFVDQRGGIARVLDQNVHRIQTILRITSKAGSIRSNHYHKKDYHFMYLESGMCEYSEKPANKPKSKIETVKMVAGDLVLTNPMVIHAVKFLQDSVLYAFTTEKRDQDKYEKDTIKVTIIE
jgi:dTDP-4-dehydrorhamnose 3,5-epimerase-like enzyme